MKYVYPATFTKENGGSFSVVFKDLESCYTCGDNLADAIDMAEDVLAFTLYKYERDQIEIPKPTELSECITADNEFINFITCDTMEYRKRHNNRAVKKTLSIPEWLNIEATARGINFSVVLQEALKEQLGYV